jgi:hypothetical protein
MRIEYKRLLLTVALLCAPLLVQAVEVVSENLVFMKEDGNSYLLQRSMRTETGRSMIFTSTRIWVWTVCIT